MWGPDISFWQKIQRIGKPASEWGKDVTTYLSGSSSQFTVFNSSPYDRHSQQVESIKPWDMLLADRQAMIDLQIYSISDEDQGRRDRFAGIASDQQLCTLLGSGGFLDSLSGRYKLSDRAQEMFFLAGVVREDNVAAVHQRAKSLELISTQADELSGFYTATINRQHESKLLDRLFDKNQRDREYVGIADILNLSQLVQFLNQPAYKPIAASIQNAVGTDYWNFVLNIGSGKHVLEIDNGLKVSNLKWSNVAQPFRGFSPASDERESGSYDSSNTVQEYRNVVKKLYLSIFDGDWKNSTDILLNHLAMVESYAYLAKFAQKEGWTRAEILDSKAGKYQLDIVRGRHPMYPDSAIENDFKYDQKYPINNWTGGNDAGKTQFIRGLAQWQLLGQQYGVVPAREARMSFRRALHTNFSRSDDSSKGKYRTSIRRWMRDVLPNLDQALVFADESTDGTFVETGIRHGLLAFATLAARDVPTFGATHYGQIAKSIESQGIGANFHMEVKGGKYTRKLIKGMDLESRGEEVATEEGFTAENLVRIAGREIAIHDTDANSLFMRDGRIEPDDEKRLSRPDGASTDFLRILAAKNQGQLKRR